MKRLLRKTQYQLPDLNSFLPKSERILILGVGGWFGQTLLNMLGKNSQVLGISSSKTPEYEIWNEKKIIDFKPTIVANFAFITRNRLLSYTREDYISTNLELIQRMKFAAELRSVKLLLNVSSGAILNPEAQKGLESSEIYGALKKIEEEVALSCVTNCRSTVVLRAFSVSGPYVRNESQYAFSSFISEALRSGKITVNSSNRVFRKYCSVGDLIALGFLRGTSGWSGVIESGGQLIELLDLAKLVASSISANVTIEAARDSLMADEYYSYDSSWEESIAETSFLPLTLSQQITTTIEYFK